MAATYSQLVTNWIAYIKRNGIADPQSAGSLVYLRQPARSDLVEFLRGVGFDDQKIEHALSTVGPPGATSIPVNTQLEFPQNSGNKFTWVGNQWKQVNAATGLSARVAKREVATVLTKLSQGITPSDAEIIAAKQALGITEASEFEDAAYSESQIKKIFKVLTDVPAQVPVVKTEADQIREINDIKMHIRDKFTPGQRAALWRILSED